MSYPTDGTIGANFSVTSTDAKFKPGTMVLGTDGTRWIYAKASATLTQYDCVVIDSSFKANAITSALCTEGASIAWPQVGVLTDEYFWGAMEGRTINIRVAAACASNVALYTTATAGVLDDTAANCLINNVKIVTTQSSDTGLSGAPAYCVFPTVGASQ